MRRLRDLQCANSGALRLLGASETPDDRATEALLHREFAADRIRGEWFRATPALLEFIEDARSRCPQPGSFDELRRRDDRLDRLAREAEEFRSCSTSRPTVCRVFEFDRRFRPRLERLRGWADLGGPLRTRTEVEVAADAIQALLPECRGCLHVLSVA